MSEPTLNRRMDSFGKDDLTIPEVKLIQATGGDAAKQAGGRAGDFWIPMMGEVVSIENGFDVILVDMQKTRTYWGSTQISTEPPQCSSDDAETFISQNGDSCKACPYFNEAPWLLEASKRREMCLVNYNLLVFRVEDMLPLIIRTSGISTGAARNLLTAFRLNRALAGQYHKAIVHVSAVKKQTPSGEAYAFVFTPKGRVPEQSVEEFRIQSASLLGVKIETIAPVEEAAKLTQGQSSAEAELEASNAVLAQQVKEKVDRELAEKAAREQQVITAKDVGTIDPSLAAAGATRTAPPQREVVHKPDAPPIRTSAAPPVKTPPKKISTDF